MFGQNKLSPLVRDDGLVLAVQEVFHTLQGEGPYAGVPAVFIRLAGCNLKCHFCDTDFDSRLDNLMPLAAIVAWVCQVAPLARQRRLVVLTGGEPLRQNVVPLIKALGSHTQLVQIETAGTLWLHDLEPLISKRKVHVVCSPKTGRINTFLGWHCEDWKYIIRAGETAAEDGLPNMSTQVPGERLVIARPPNPRHTVWLSPCDEQDHERTAVNVTLAKELCLKFGYRLSLQTHKLLGLP